LIATTVRSSRPIKSIVTKTKNDNEIEHLFLVAYTKAANAVVDGKPITEVRKIMQKYNHRFEIWFSECQLNWRQMRMTEFLE
jgi:hypothetical protein